MIHVCYSLRDESGKYSKYTGTSIQSLLDNTQEEVTIHVLHDSTLSDENRRKLSIIAYQHDQEIQFYNVEKLAPNAIELIRNQFPNIKNYWGTVASFYRALIPEILDSDRAIYLDTDIIVNLDINEFWQLDMQNFPLAAVPESEQRSVANPSQYRLETVKNADYFNAGVFMMDLNRLRVTGGGAVYSPIA